VEITKLSATTMASLVRQREISCAELVEAHLKVIAESNPAVNAIIDLSEDALDIAKAMDASTPPTQSKPLRGVPITVKSNVDCAGYCNANGIPDFNNIRCVEDSAVVANLKEAGAIIVGRTSTPEFSLRWFTSNPILGVTHNPWHPGVTPGGSSGAAAVSVATGMSAVAHGNDLGGSLRYPAYCCGVATIRPSLGQIPAFNPGAAAERPPITQTMSVQGPIARNIADVHLALQAMSAQSSQDPLWHAAKTSGRRRSKSLRIGIAENPYDAPVDDSVVAAVNEARRGFERCGADVSDCDVPYACETAQLWGELLFCETQALLLPVIRKHGSAQLNTVIDAYGDAFRPLDVNGLLAGMQQRIQYQRAWSRLFDDIDVLVMPTSLKTAFENDLDFKRPEEIPEILQAQQPLCSINLLGLPAVAMPTHVQNGVPLGVQLIGPMHDDYFLLHAAKQLEQEIGTVLDQLPK